MSEVEIEEQKKTSQEKYKEMVAEYKSKKEKPNWFNKFFR